MNPYKLARNQAGVIPDLSLHENGVPVEADLQGVANFQDFLDSHPEYEAAGYKMSPFFSLYGPAQKVQKLPMPPDVQQFHENRRKQAPGVLPDKMYQYGPDRPQRGHSPWVRREFG